MMRLPAILCTVCLAAFAEDPPPRPRIGLALGGGGALGLSHIGVLRVLEELRVPVDVIAGTSMGSIIAGLYASGMSPGEIEALLLRQDWEEVLRDESPREELAFRRKLDDQRYLVEIGVGAAGLKTGTGMAAGQKLNNLLERATLRVAGVHDFDRLPIPYRAVATDLNTGRAHVIASGRLAAAMRASMAVPGVFTAVVMEGHVLVDGGVVNNLPVDVVKSMGADVVIAVDVGASADQIDPASLASLKGILGRTYAVAQRPGQIEALARADVGIQPELKGFSATEFARVAEFIPRGEAAARASAQTLKRFSRPEEEYLAHLSRQRRPMPERLPVDRVEISGNRRVDAGIIQARIRSRPGGIYEEDQLTRDLLRVYGLGEFEQVLVQYEPGPAGDNVLRFAATEKPAGPNYLGIGLNLRTNFDEDSDWGLLLNLTRMSVNSFGGEWRNEAEIGSQRRFLSEFHQPLSRDGVLFLSPSVEWRDRDQDLYRGGDRVAEYGVDTRLAGVDVGLQLRHWAEVRAGPFWGRAKAGVHTGASDLPELEEDLGGLRVRFIADRQDRTLFTRQGGYVEASALWSMTDLGAERTYDAFNLVLRDTRSAGDHTFTAGVRGGVASAEVPEFAKFTLGGPFTFRGLAEDQFRGEAYGAAGLGYRYRLLSLPAALGRGVYALANADYGNVWQDRDDVRLSDGIFGAAAGIGADTAAGPLYLGYGRAEGGHSQWYLSLGTVF